MLQIAEEKRKGMYIYTVAATIAKLNKRQLTKIKNEERQNNILDSNNHYCTI